MGWIPLLQTIEKPKTKTKTKNTGRLGLYSQTREIRNLYQYLYRFEKAMYRDYGCGDTRV